MKRRAMGTRFATACTLISLVLTGGIGGFFYAYSVSVMPGLDVSAPDHAVAAMQGINRAVRNPVFFVTFFVTPVVTLLSAALAWRAGCRRAAGSIAVAAIVYLLGAFLPTALVHVPMNEALAIIDLPAGTNEVQAVWSGYSERWTAWNHVRTAASGLSLILIGIGLLGIGPHRIPAAESSA